MDKKRRCYFWKKKKKKEKKTLNTNNSVLPLFFQFLIFLHDLCIPFTLILMFVIPLFHYYVDAFFQDNKILLRLFLLVYMC